MINDYFLNKNSQNQLMELTPPDDWDGIDYSKNDFSNSVTIKKYKREFEKNTNPNL